MKCIRFSSFLLLFIFPFFMVAQSNDEAKSTADLSFLIGEWDIVRTYQPTSDRARILKGKLFCAQTLDDQFIECTYEIERPNKIRALDKVYYNYNSIYNQYESIWLSSTWPIKVLLQGTLQKDSNNITLSTAAEFPIEGGLIEYVKDELVLKNNRPSTRSFQRKTFIRTSKDEVGDWLHHMTEVSTRIR